MTRSSQSIKEEIDQLDSEIERLKSGPVICLVRRVRRPRPCVEKNIEQHRSDCEKLFKGFTGVFRRKLEASYPYR